MVYDPQAWILGLAGGALIGAAAATYLLVNGRILGISGIFGGLVDGTGTDTARERLAFIAGVVGVPALVAVFLWPTETGITSNLAVIIIGGLLVGIGTRIANGCTSGHGVCGISRLSFRGIMATGLYIFAGGLTFHLLAHVLELI